MLLSLGEIKNYILSLNQASLFASYLDIDESAIEDCLQSSSNKTDISNPIRSDNNPSLTFIQSTDNDGSFKIRMCDRACALYRGDIFDLVGILFGYNPYDKRGFLNICNKILSDLDNKKIVTTKQSNILVKDRYSQSVSFTIRNWNDKDDLIWSKLLTRKELEEGKVYPVNSACIYSNDTNYVYTYKDPCYAYYLDNYKETAIIKFYFPKRFKKNERPRFITNNNIYPLEALNELNKADILIITKSRKDTLVIRKLIKSIDTIYKIQITNFAGEGIRLSKEYIEKLFSIYKYIFINVDFDRAGIEASIYYRDTFYIDTLFITNGKYGSYNNGGKDISDVYKNNGRLSALNLINEALNFVINRIKQIKLNEL